MKILVSAYSCEPGRGSEAGAGWAWARAAAERHEVWLLTRRKNAAAIRSEVEAGSDVALHPVFLDLPARFRRWKRGRRGLYPYYLAWQMLAYRAGRRLHERVGIDVAHHLTFASDWLPAGVAWLPDVPFVWGPVGGAMDPAGMPWRHLGWRGLITECVRLPATGIPRAVFADAMARRAALVIAQNPEVADRFGYARTVIEPNIALAMSEIPIALPENRDPEATRRAVFAGRLLPLKGLRPAIRAIAKPHPATWRLEVYGDGPEAEPCRRLAARLGVLEQVQFHGTRPRAEVLEAISAADAFLLPTMHDAASWAIAEALTMGCPVVCLDRGGPGSTVGSDQGIKVPVTGDIVSGLASAMDAIDGRGRRTSRWSVERLPELLDGWYTEAAREQQRRD